MNRRGFLKKFGTGVAATAIAVGTSHFPFDEESMMFSLDWAKPEVIGDYFDYTSFSKFALDESIDKTVLDAAAELGRQAGLSTAAMLGRVYDHQNV